MLVYDKLYMYDKLENKRKRGHCNRGILAIAAAFNEGINTTNYILAYSNILR